MAISLNSQVFEITEIYTCKTEREIKRIEKRFDRAVIGKDYYGERGNYYMALEEGDTDEYYERLGIKFYCIPKRKRVKVQLTVLFYDENEWDDKEGI